MIVPTLGLAVLVGVALGLFGGGGSILTVPILVYVAGQNPKSAIATSLVVVAATSAAGAVEHARAGRVRWRTGVLFGAAGMAGAYAGARAAQFVPGSWLLVAFGAMMAVTAVAMLRGARHVGVDRSGEVPVLHVVGHGVVVGAVTGIVGAGGGFLVVPALALLGGLPMTAAVGTSLVVIAMKSTAGLLGYLHSVTIDWPLALGVTAAAIAGTVVGGRLAGRVGQDRLRRLFGWFVLAMAVVVLGQQVPVGVRDAVLGSPVTWVAAGAVLAGALVACFARRLPERHA